MDKIITDNSKVNMNLQEMYVVTKNEDRKQWEFKPKKGVDQFFYTVAFYECDNLIDAWIAVYKAITKKAKRQLTNI